MSDSIRTKAAEFMRDKARYNRNVCALALSLKIENATHELMMKEADIYDYIASQLEVTAND